MLFQGSFTRLSRSYRQQWGVRIQGSLIYNRPGDEVMVQVTQENGETVMKLVRILKIYQIHAVGLILGPGGLPENPGATQSGP